MIMLPEKRVCKSCGGEYEIKEFCTLTVCPYCGKETEFEGFKYKKIDYSRSMYAGIEKRTDCPKCRSQNMIYSDEKGCFVCLDCRYEMTQKWLNNSVLWFCDKCEAYLNIQSGFSESAGTWKCKNCGFDNDVTEDNVF